MTAGPVQVSRARRAATAVRLRSQGVSYREIAEEIGCSVSTAHSLVTRTLARLPVDDVDTIRQIEGARLDSIWRALLPKIELGDPDACAVGIRVSTARRRMYGIDAPLRAEIANGDITVVFDPSLRPADPEPAGWNDRPL